MFLAYASLTCYMRTFLNGSQAHPEASKDLTFYLLAFALCIEGRTFKQRYIHKYKHQAQDSSDNFESFTYEWVDLSGV